MHIFDAIILHRVILNCLSARRLIRLVFLSLFFTATQGRSKEWPFARPIRQHNHGRSFILRFCLRSLSRLFTFSLFSTTTKNDDRPVSFDTFKLGCRQMDTVLAPSSIGKKVIPLTIFSFGSNRRPTATIKPSASNQTTNKQPWLRFPKLTNKYASMHGPNSKHRRITRRRVALCSSKSKRLLLVIVVVVVVVVSTMSCCRVRALFSLLLHQSTCVGWWILL